MFDDGNLVGTALAKRDSDRRYQELCLNVVDDIEAMSDKQSRRSSSAQGFPFSVDQASAPRAGSFPHQCYFVDHMMFDLWLRGKA